MYHFGGAVSNGKGGEMSEQMNETQTIGTQGGYRMPYALFPRFVWDLVAGEPPEGVDRKDEALVWLHEFRLAEKLGGDDQYKLVNALLRYRFDSALPEDDGSEVHRILFAIVEKEQEDRQEGGGDE